jgi:hypothetical protein
MNLSGYRYIATKIRTMGYDSKTFWEGGMTRYLVLISLIVAGAGLATARKPTGGSTGGAGCKHTCSLAYNACIAAATDSSTGTIDQTAAGICVNDYYGCVATCH